MDNITQKLERIDRELAGSEDWFPRLVSIGPLVFAAVGLITGIVIQQTFAVGLYLWLILLAVSFVSAVTVFILRSKNPSMALSICAILSFVSLGGIRLVDFNKAGVNDIRNMVTMDRQPATIRGLVVTEPFINKNRQWAFARFKHSDPGSSFYLKVNEVEATEGWVQAVGTIRVRVNQPILDLRASDNVEFYCLLGNFKAATNPGQFDIARYMARKNVFIAASVGSAEAVEILSGTKAGLFTRVKSKFGELANNALLEGVSDGQPSQGLLQALLLGYRGNIDSDTWRAFRRTGLLHFISLSGMHLGILMFSVWWLCKTAGLAKPARAVICIIALTVFLLIVPPRAPTLRAAIICFVFCASFFFRRSPKPYNTLSLAAIILLLIRPTQLFEAGWQLSFACVLGILLFTNRIEYFFNEHVLKYIANKSFSWPIVRVIKFSTNMFSVGLGAWLGAAGVLLYHFYIISPLSALWTVIVFPLVAVTLTAGYLKIILSLLLPSVAVLLGYIVNFLSVVMIWFVKLIAEIVPSEILIGHVSIGLIIFYYGLIVFGALVYFKKSNFKKAICTIGALAIIIFLGVSKYHNTHRDNLILTCLDVGHGQAIVVQLPGKSNLLFDAGSLHTGNVGERIINPFLNYKGIKRIEACLISHNDTDHINGIPEIVSSGKVEAIYADNTFFAKTDRWGTAKFLSNCLSEKGFQIESISDNISFDSPAKIKFLWPLGQAEDNEHLRDNDKSLVTMIEFAGRKILLCSDVEKFAQRQLLKIYPSLKADILVSPHHGSINSLEPGFLERIAPEIVITSCNRRQYDKLSSAQKKGLYTARDGAVIISINSDGKMSFEMNDNLYSAVFGFVAQ
ncbi:DNA internalization-related competence protein ComEC/Rec2 [Planctomycetota bacterium]